MNKRNEDGEDVLYNYPPFQIMAKPASVDYVAQINKGFVHSEQFEDIVRILDSANEGDTFTLNLTTPGGSLQSVIPLLNAMDNTAAHVHVHIESDVASAGTLIIMKAHSVSINDFVEVMCHQVSFGAGGPGWNVECRVNHVQKASKKLCRELYKHFLTDDEIERMLTGTEYFMDKEEFLERYQKRSAAITGELEAMIIEHQKQQLEAEEQAVEKPPRKRKPLAIGNKDVDNSEGTS